MSVDAETIDATKQELATRLKASGEYDKMKAMIVASSLQALNDEGDDTFKASPELLEAKAAGNLNFQVVGEWLRALGLNYTFNVLAMESGIDKKVLDAKKKDVAAGVGAGVDGTAQAALLDQLIANKGAAPAASAASVPASPAESPKNATSAPAAQQHNVPAGVKMTVLPSTKNPVPKAGKKMVDETLYEIYCFDGGEFTRFNQIDDQPLQLAELRNCKIYCYDSVDNVTVDECEDCELIVAACQGSVFIRDSKNMKVTVACKQLRTRDCHEMDVRLYAMTDPVVESSSHIQIRPFNLRLPNLSAKFAKSKLDAAINRFVHIYDFTPDKAGLAQPHFEIVHPNHGLQFEDFGGEIAPVDAPAALEDVFYNRRAPTESSESGANKSHNIKTGASAWNQQQAQEKAEAEAEEEKPAPVAAPAATAVTKPAAAAPKATGMLSRDSDSDRYSDFSDSEGTPMSSVGDADTDDDDEF
jgi:protein XRP2